MASPASVRSVLPLLRHNPDDVGMMLAFGLATLAVGAEDVGLAPASWGLVGASLLHGAWWLWWTRGVWRGRSDVLAGCRPPQSG